MPDHHYVAFDTETTGLRPDQGDRIVELGAVLYSASGEELKRASSLCRPGISIPRNAQHVHGITDGMVCQAPSTSAVVAGFFKQLLALGGPASPARPGEGGGST